MLRLNPDEQPYNVQNLTRPAGQAAAILQCHTENPTAAIIARLPASLRAVCNLSAGVDYVDLEAARQKGLIVFNTPEALSGATAEIAKLLMPGQLIS